MYALKAIPRIVLAALLLAVMTPVWGEGARAGIRAALNDASNENVRQEPCSPQDEASLQSGLHGIITAMRRGQDRPPAGLDHPGAAGLLPQLQLAGQSSVSTAGRPLIPAVTGGFLRVQEKLLFPKHWFW